MANQATLAVATADASGHGSAVTASAHSPTSKMTTA